MLDRREFLGLALGALACDKTAWRNCRRATSVIWLWMADGASQTDTWDPKPGEKGVSLFDSIGTSAADIRISELLPRCAAQMMHLAIVRSMTRFRSPGETVLMDLRTGRTEFPRPEFPPLGTIVAHERRDRDPGMPGYAVLGPAEFAVVGGFGEAAQPQRVEGLVLARAGEDSPRAKARRELLEAQCREWETARGLESARESRVRLDALLAGPLAGALEVGKEPEELRREYGPGFGEHCLLARRLVQAGCPFVEVGLSGWAAKADYRGAVRHRAGVLDAGMGTLIRDLAEKDLLKSTLVVWCGPHGRSPGLNGGAGRDIAVQGFSVVLAGGGIRGGRVHGDTGKRGMDCAKPVSPADLAATVLKACAISNRRYHGPNHTWSYLDPRARPLDGLF